MSGTLEQAPIPQTTLSAMQLAVAGARLLDTGHAEEAEKTWREAVRLDPGCNTAWSCLTDLLARAKRLPEAADCLDRLLALSERSAANLLMFGESYCALERNEQARELLSEAARIDPSFEVRVRVLIAKLDAKVEDWEAAIRGVNRVLALDPGNLAALEIRHKCWYCISCVPEEIADHRRYIATQPDAEKHSRLLFKLNYLAETTPESLFDESRRWNEQYAVPLRAETAPHPNTPDPDRRLKIGYVSPDLQSHAIMKLLPGVFERYDERQFEVFVYSINTKGDDVTESVRRRMRNFVVLPASRQEIAKRVRMDEIDILVDLAGHTMHASAYLAFAMKPAPLQVTWLGALATTGLDTIDYFIGDAHMPCPGTESSFSEKIYRLGRVPCCYRPLPDLAVSDSPYFQNGHITFGCFNDPRKITRDVAQLWSVILHMLPDARLFLKYDRLERGIVQSRLRDWFSGYGIGEDRLRFEGSSQPREYFATWNQVDIALDPFPYNGGTTTMDALWMGVPVVTMPGRLAVACGGDSLLSAVGLPVAQTPEEYISLAGTLAKTIPLSPDIRRRVRQAMASSALLDELGLVRSIEAAYRDMWRTWCGAQESH